MAAGVVVDTVGAVVRFTMSEEAATKIKDRFSRMAAQGDSPSYIDCVLFDAAVERLGLEREYYGYDDAELAERMAERRAAEHGRRVKTIDVTDTWHEL